LERKSTPAPGTCSPSAEVLFFLKEKNLLNLVFLKEKNLLNLSAALFAYAYSELLSNHGTVFSSYNISA
jgi:hypothetical protein